MDRVRRKRAYVLLSTYEQVQQRKQRDCDGNGDQSNHTPALSTKDEPIDDTYLYISRSASTAPDLPGPSAEQAASQLNNPAVKVKKDSQLSWEVVADRMSLVGLARYPIKLDSAIRDFTFNRHYLHKLYGGSFVDTFPHPEPARVRVHGLDDFMCLRLDYNPHAPVNSGDPGLLFTYRSTDNFAKYAARVNRLFVRTQASPALWQYMGQYRMYTSEPLTKDEFARQPPLVRKTWAKAVLTRKQGNDICVRVHLRKLHGREPSRGELTKTAQSSQRLKVAKSALTWADIAAAYEHGEEEIKVYAMKCVGYDTQFQVVLARNYKKFSPPKPKSKSKGGDAKAAALERKRKRGPATPEASDPENEGVDVKSESGESGEDDEGASPGAEEPRYVPRPTRTRAQASAKRIKLE